MKETYKEEIQAAKVATQQALEDASAIIQQIDTLIAQAEQKLSRTSSANSMAYAVRKREGDMTAVAEQALIDQVVRQLSDMRAAIDFRGGINSSLETIYNLCEAE